MFDVYLPKKQHEEISDIKYLMQMEIVQRRMIRQSKWLFGKTCRLLKLYVAELRAESMTKMWRIISSASDINSF